MAKFQNLKLTRLIHRYIANYLIKNSNNISLFKKISVNEVKLTLDNSIATVYVTNLQNKLETAEQQQQFIKKIEEHQIKIKNYLAKTLTIRKCPKLIFKYDDLISYSNHIENLIKSVK